jgi:diguanylate cyclase (GGDEF)-like protein
VSLDKKPAFTARPEYGAVLIVDDDEMARDVLSRRLERIGYSVTPVPDGHRALELIAEQTFDVVLLDIKMPGLTGFQVLQAIRRIHSVTDLPVVMVTASDDSASIVEALELGASDYVTKPLDFPVALARIRTQLMLRQMVLALEDANEKLERLSFLDGLTNIANRRRFDEFLQTEWRRGVRNGQPLSAIVVDIDSFKAYNDTYGHEAGDETLRKVAGALSATPNRPADLVARYGGEEFVIVLPGTDAAGARHLAERLRAGVERLAIPHATSATAPRVTISLGVATTVPRRDASPQSLIEAADRALYEAKHGGRNRVCVSPAPVAGGR